MAKSMQNLPEGMIPDKDNIVYWDTEKQKFYFIQWEDYGCNDIAHRHYIEIPYQRPPVYGSPPRRNSR